MSCGPAVARLLALLGLQGWRLPSPNPAGILLFAAGRKLHVCLGPAGRRPCMLCSSVLCIQGFAVEATVLAIERGLGGSGSAGVFQEQRLNQPVIPCTVT